MKKVYKFLFFIFLISTFYLLTGCNKIKYVEEKESTSYTKGYKEHYTNGEKFYIKEDGKYKEVEFSTLILPIDVNKPNLDELIKYEEVKATSTKEGNKEYYQDKSGNIFQYIENKLTLSSKDNVRLAIDVRNPNPKELIEVKAVKPTSTKKGNVTYYTDLNNNIYVFKLTKYILSNRQNVILDRDLNNPEVSELTLVTKKQATSTTYGVLEHFKDSMSNLYLLKNGKYFLVKLSDLRSEKDLNNPNIEELVFIKEKKATSTSKGNLAHYVDKEKNTYLLEESKYRYVNKNEVYTEKDLTNPNIEELVLVQAKEETSTEKGNIEHYVDKENNYYILEGSVYKNVGESEIFLEKDLNKPNVNELKFVAAKEATSTTKGNVEHYIDKENNYYILEGSNYRLVIENNVYIEKDLNKPIIEELIYVEKLFSTSSKKGYKEHFKDKDNNIYIKDGENYLLANKNDILLEKDLNNPNVSELRYVRKIAATSTTKGNKQHYIDDDGNIYINAPYYNLTTREEITIEKDINNPIIGLLNHILPKVAYSDERGNIEHYRDSDGNTYVIREVVYEYVNPDEVIIAENINNPNPKTIEYIELVKATSTKTGFKAHYKDRNGNFYIKESEYSNEYKLVKEETLIIQKDIHNPNINELITIPFKKQTYDENGNIQYYMDSENHIYIKNNDVAKGYSLATLEQVIIQKNYVTHDGKFYENGILVKDKGRITTLRNRKTKLFSKNDFSNNDTVRVSNNDRFIFASFVLYSDFSYDYNFSYKFLTSGETNIKKISIFLGKEEWKKGYKLKEIDTYGVDTNFYKEKNIEIKQDYSTPPVTIFIKIELIENKNIDFNNFNLTLFITSDTNSRGYFYLTKSYIDENVHFNQKITLELEKRKENNGYIKEVVLANIKSRVVIVKINIAKTLQGQIINKNNIITYIGENKTSDNEARVWGDEAKIGIKCYVPCIVEFELLYKN